ncbi:MAG: YggT family protein [Clostridia bacterium]|nr:YggT family protein [Clostridia bacterium]
MDDDNKNFRDNEIPSNRPSADGTIGYDSFRIPLWFIKTRNAINYVLGLIEVLLAFRFLFMLLGANPRSGFVSFLYTVTGIFVSPFTGIFNSFTTGGLAARSVFDPATLIGMIVYAVIAWGLVSLIRIKALRDGKYD